MKNSLIRRFKSVIAVFVIFSMFATPSFALVNEIRLFGQVAGKNDAPQGADTNGTVGAQQNNNDGAQVQVGQDTAGTQVQGNNNGQQAGAANGQPQIAANGNQGLGNIFSIFMQFINSFLRGIFGIFGGGVAGGGNGGGGAGFFGIPAAGNQGNGGNQQQFAVGGNGGNQQGNNGAGRAANGGLNVPLMAQPDGRSCGPTSVTMVLAYYGIKSTVAENSRGVLGRGGASHQGMLDKLRANGLNGSKMEYGVSLAWIKEQTDAGKPVLCSVRENYGPRSTKGHIVVVTGVTPSGNVIINDPAGGKRHEINGTTFMRANRGRMAISASR